MATRKKATAAAKEAVDAGVEASESNAAPTPSVDELEAGFQAEKAALEAKLAAADSKVEEMLARIAEDKDAQADAPSGIEIGIDLNFLGEDPSDIEPHLQRAGQDHEPDKFHYRWVSTNPRMYAKRRTQGYEPVPGGVTKGDQVACRMPKEMHKKRQALLERRKQLLNEGTSGTFESVVRREGGAPFDGSRSKADGLR